MFMKNYKLPIVSLICVVALLCTMTCTTFVSLAETATATSDTTTYDERVEETVLAENDYSTAKTGLDWWNSNYSNTCGDIRAYADPLDANNMVLQLNKFRTSNHQIILGADYSTVASVYNCTTTITPVAGTTYQIELDWYAPQNPVGNDIIVYAASGPKAKGAFTADYSNVPFFDYQTEILRISTTDNLPDDYQTVKAAFTIPSDTVITDGNILLLYVRADITNNTGLPCFDNIKVSKLEKVTEELVAYDTYSNATVRESGFYVPNAMGADSYPVYDPLDKSNKVIRYRQQYGTGLAIIGSQHKGYADSIAAQAITAVAGKTYNIKFDYYVEGTTGTNGTSVRFAVGPVTGNYPTVGTMSFEKEILKLSSNRNVSTNGWVRDYTATVTIPEGTDFTNGDKLVIKMTLGGFNTIFYIDNLKVTSEAGRSPFVAINNKELYFTDYSSAEKNAGAYSGFYDYSGDIWPRTDPLDDANMVLGLQKFRTSNHQIILGTSYAWANGVRDCVGIVPAAGKSYQIDIDWYSPENPAGHDVIVYAAIGPKKRGNFGSDYSNAPCYDYQTELFRVSCTEKLPLDWSSESFIVTIPDDTTVTDGNILLLYVRGDVTNNTGNPCFDNIRLTELSGISAELNVGDEHSSKIYPSGKIPADLYPANDGKAVLWYTDRSRKNPFSITNFQSTTPTHITLYGEYESAERPFVVGDINGDSITTAADLIPIRRYMLDMGDNFIRRDRADANRDGEYDILDLVRLKKIVSGSMSKGVNINGNSDYSIVVPTADANFTDKNAELVANLLGESVPDTEAEAEYEIVIGSADREGIYAIDNETAYSIMVSGNKVYVNGGNVKSLGAAIIALKGYMDTGYSFTDGCVVDFEYLSVEHPADMLGVVPENVFNDDFATAKESIITESSAIENPAATLSLENGSITDAARARGEVFASQINSNKVADFNKGDDYMVHVSSFAIINDVIYTTYYVNNSNSEENPVYQKPRFVYSPLSDPTNKTYIELQKPGDDCYGKTVEAIYDTILMQKDEDTLFLMWTAKLSGNYYRLYRTYTISTDTLSTVRVNRFKVGDVTNDFSVTGIKSALTENEVAFKNMYSDIGIMQKLSTRVENGETYYYTGAYCGDFNCIIKSRDLITWEYVAQPDFANQSKWENATYVIGDKCYYFVRQVNTTYGFLTCYDLVSGEWSTPVLIEDDQSRSDFIVYDNQLYLVHAPKNSTGVAERQHIGIVRINQENLANSEVVVHAYMGNSCFYPFVQYANGDSDTIYMSYTVWRKQIRLSKFDPLLLVSEITE